MNAAAPDCNDDIPTLSFGFPHDRSALSAWDGAHGGRGRAGKRGNGQDPTPPWAIGANVAPALAFPFTRALRRVPRTEEREPPALTATRWHSAVFPAGSPRPDTLERLLPRSDEAGDVAHNNQGAFRPGKAPSLCYLATYSRDLWP
jgi:hypothetical protein